MMETLPQELIALRAVVEPRLMHARRELTSRDTPTALSGMFQPGVTLQALARQSRLQFVAHLGEPR